LKSIAGKDIFGGNTGRIGLAGSNIGDIGARADIIAGVDVTITT
jgi:hypothetical protein